jgi:hypothetical protein
MTPEIFAQGYAALVAAYSISAKLGAQSQEVYWDMLQAIPDAKFQAGVKRCLATCKFFPTIAELGEASLPAKTELSNYMVQTRNGMDRIPIKVTWDEQVERLQEQKSLPNNVRKMLRDY